ncbi:MAG: glycosyltransferase family 2 protein [Opitutaceae bacterium]|nr:glycosyltransferase family 2 protein [Cytophagales bacterium]
MTIQNPLPFFSIILPTYNRGHMVVTAIQSVVHQKFEDWELIIIDDGSTDNTRQILAPFLSDTRINYNYQTNQERSAARNHGIEIAKGRYICFLDSDDYYLPNHLEVLHNIIAAYNQKEGVYYSLCQFEKDGKRTNIKPMGKVVGNGIYNVLNKGLLLTNSVCVTASLLENNKFPVHLSIFEDNHLWIRIICQSQLIIAEEVTNIVIEHSNRSLNYSAEDLDKKTKKYMQAVNDLFYEGKYPEIASCINEDQKRTFIASKYIVMSYEAFNLLSVKLVYKYLYNSFRTKIIQGKILDLLKLFFFSWIYIGIKRFFK